jgi:hypothetical protein
MLEKIRQSQVKNRISLGLERGYDVLRDYMGGSKVLWYDNRTRQLEGIIITEQRQVPEVFACLPKDREIFVYFGNDVQVFDPKSWKRIA